MEFVIAQPWGMMVALASALAMDAFSLCLGMGMQQNLHLRQRLMISIVIGLFHVMMPLCGMAIGGMAGRTLGHTALWLGAVTLILLGIRMVWTARSTESPERYRIHGLWASGIFALSVSVDAFGAGLSFGAMQAPIGVMVSLIGMMGGLCAAGGFWLGRFVGRTMGAYGQWIGGGVLLFWGIVALYESVSQS